MHFQFPNKIENTKGKEILSIFGLVMVLLLQAASTPLIAANATIQVSPNNLSFTAPVRGSDPALQTVNLSNSAGGGTTLNWTATTDQPWFTVSPTSGATTTGTDVLTIGARLHGAGIWTTETSTSSVTWRYGHAAVWTGSKMIVWGGFHNADYSLEGDFYDPATDTWTINAMNTSGAASIRINPCAVWTGTEMIIWGGESVGGAVGSGRRYNPATNTWNGVTATGAPSARSGASAAWTGTEMIVWGGSNAHSLRDGGRYNPATDTWSATPISTINAPSARAYHKAVWDGTEMIVWGGYDGTTTEGLTNTGGRYNPATNSWVPGGTSTVNAPQIRKAFTAVWDGKQMIVWGGSKVSGGPINVLDTGGRYDPVTDSWATGGLTVTGAPTARQYHTAVWTGSEMIVFGGQDATTYPTPKNLNTGKRFIPGFDLHQGTYTGNLTVTDPAATNNPQNIPITFTVTGPTLNVTPTSLTFTGTVGGGDPAQQFVILSNTGPAETTLNWSAMPDAPWLTVSPSSGTITTGTSTLTIGAQLQPTNCWTAATSMTSAPPPRLGHVAVWTGSRVLIWGGQELGGYVNTGAIFDPGTNTWSPTGMSMTNAPVARTYATAIWTGTEMIVWGGNNASSQNLDTGGRYDPVTDTWSIAGTSPVGAPLGRHFHSAVWTGTEMIVWGGYDIGSSRVRNGGRYNPATDTWAAGAVSLTNAPSARAGHVAVWTGTEMIIWGGSTGSSSNDGWRYNPATDTWSTTPLSAANVPAARSSSSGVWTGTEMIIWGGSDTANNKYNTGGRYNPATDSWSATPLATFNAPSPRYANSACWCDDKMVVWGGYNGGSRLDDGGIYQPVQTLTPGTYTGHVKVSDPFSANNPQLITVTFVVNPSGGSNVAPIILSPASASPNPVVSVATTTLSVTANDPDSGPSALTYTWSKVSGPGTVTFSPNGTTGANTSTATFNTSGTYTLQVAVSDGSDTVTSQIISLAVTLPNTAPTVATAAATAPNPVTGSTTVLSVLGTDDGGEPALTYSWSATGPATVTYSANGTNSAKNATATFTKAGTYNVTATISDGSLSTTSAVSVTVNQTLTTIAVSPSAPSVQINTTQLFTAAGADQFGNLMTIAPAPTWTVSGGGSIGGSNGIFTAGATPGGPFTVTATSGAKSGTAQVTVTPAPNTAPTVATVAAAAPNPVTGTTTALNVLGADDGGEPALTYTWSATGPATVTYSANATNGAKASTATFTQAGSYVITATISDGSFSTTSVVNVTVNQTLTTITVTPGTLSMATGGTQIFTATAQDQFGAALISAPTITWSLSDGGTIGSATGIYTAENYPGGPYTVTAQSGAISGTANVTLTGGINPVSISIGSINLAGTVGSTTPVSQTITLTNNSSSAVNISTASNQSWFTATPPGPVAIPAHGTLSVTVTADPTSLNGTYNATLTITPSVGSPVTIPVTFTVSTATSATGKRGKGCAISSTADTSSLAWLCLIFTALLGQLLVAGKRRRLPKDAKSAKECATAG